MRICTPTCSGVVLDFESSGPWFKSDPPIRKENGSNRQQVWGKGKGEESKGQPGRKLEQRERKGEQKAKGTVPQEGNVPGNGTGQEIERFFFKKRGVIFMEVS